MKTAPISTEYSGCMIHGNQWFKIGLSRSQAARLKQAAKALLRPEHRSSSRAAWYLLNAALDHLDIMEMLLHEHQAVTRKAHPNGGWLFDELLWEDRSRAMLHALN